MNMEGNRSPMATSNNSHWVTQACSLLFVPATRPDRFTKASKSGADGIILDLEDGVAEAQKSPARANALAWLESNDRTVIRVNGFGTPWQPKDLEWLASYGAVTVMVPKVESRDDIQVVAEALDPGSVIIACIESARGLSRLADICSAPGVVRLGFGNVDLATDLGVDAMDRTALQHSRSAVVVESRAHDLAPPLDGITLDAKDEEAARADSSYAASLGFGGRMCIHPSQVASINEAFQPSTSQLEWARKIVARSNESAVLLVEGQMVDKPVVERARRLLARG